MVRVGCNQPKADQNLHGLMNANCAQWKTVRNRKVATRDQILTLDAMLKIFTYRRWKEILEKKEKKRRFETRNFRRLLLSPEQQQHTLTYTHTHSHTYTHKQADTHTHTKCWCWFHIHSHYQRVQSSFMKQKKKAFPFILWTRSLQFHGAIKENFKKSRRKEMIMKKLKW